MSVRTSPRRRSQQRTSRRPRWIPPAIGDTYVRSSDQAVHMIKNVYRQDRQVQLAPCDGGRPVYVFARELDAEWERVVR